MQEEEKTGSQLRTIEGMKYQLDKHSDASGEVFLGDATAHWWLLPENPIAQTDIWESKAHCALLYQNELYDFQTNASGRGRLRQFGIVFGTGRVVIYIEPDVEQSNVYATTSRVELRINREKPDWEKWAKAFRAQLPSELEEMMDNIATKSGSKDFRSAIKQRLKEISELFRISRYRSSRSGTHLVDGVLPGGSPRTGVTPPSTTPSRPVVTNPPNDTGGSGSLYKAFLTNDGVPAEPGRQVDNFPNMKWVTLENEGREDGDLEDRAARYISEENLLLINGDFRAFKDLIKYVSKEYNPEGGDNEDKIICDVVQETIVTQLTETVLGVLSLQNSPWWSADKVGEALSEEALTSSVMPRFFMIKTIFRSVGQQIRTASVAS